jgi:hypothetical protein
VSSADGTSDRLGLGIDASELPEEHVSLCSQFSLIEFSQDIRMLGTMSCTSTYSSKL